MSLQKALGMETVPTVTEILANIDTAVSSGNFSKVITKDKAEYFFLGEDAANIDTNPNDYIVRHSSKHGCHFIVPVQSNGFNKF